jgi:hypothetical protein
LIEKNPQCSRQIADKPNLRKTYGKETKAKIGWAEAAFQAEDAGSIPTTRSNLPHMIRSLPQAVTGTVSLSRLP